jgi:hypothetical protein
MTDNDETGRVLVDWDADGYRTYDPVPRYATHCPPGGLAASSAGVPAYRPWSLDQDSSSEGATLRRAFRGMYDIDRTGLVWLAPVYSVGRCEFAGRPGRPAVLVDLTALDPGRLRLTGQAEGYVVHAGPIPRSAVVATVTGRDTVADAIGQQPC